MGSGIGGDPGVGSGIGGWTGSIGVSARATAGTSCLSHATTRCQEAAMPDHDPAHEAEALYTEEADREWADGAPPNTFPSGETVKADRRDAQTDAGPDREPTEEEEAEVRGRTVDPAVAAAYREATARGAELRGEGRIDP